VSGKNTNDFYDSFYGRGGWSYDEDQELPLLRDLVAAPAGWLAGGRGKQVLELGCGRGDHAHYLSKLGLDVTAVDLSPVGIEEATKAYPDPRFIAADVTTWEPDEPGFAGIFVRGMSIYHYELLGVNRNGHDVPALTARFFSWLRPGGVFVLQIATDFSGRAPDDGRVHFSKRSTYEKLFVPLGSVFRTTDWKGRTLINDEHAAARGQKGILIFTRKRAS